MITCPICKEELQPVTEDGRVIAYACQESACGWTEWTVRDGTPSTVFATCDRCGCPMVTCEETTLVNGPRLDWPVADRLYCNGCNTDKARTFAVPREAILSNHKQLAAKNCNGALDCECLQGVLL